MNKIKKLSINIGSVVAILIMLSPIIILSLYDRFSKRDFWICFIIAIFYDIYMYSVIEKDKYISDTKKLFEDVFNGKSINSKTEEEKLNWYKVICISMFMDYFKDYKEK